MASESSSSELSTSQLLPTSSSSEPNTSQPIAAPSSSGAGVSLPLTPPSSALILSEEGDQSSPSSPGGSTDLSSHTKMNVESLLGEAIKSMTREAHRDYLPLIQLLTNPEYQPISASVVETLSEQVPSIDLEAHELQYQAGIKITLEDTIIGICERIKATIEAFVEGDASILERHTILREFFCVKDPETPEGAKTYYFRHRVRGGEDCGFNAIGISRKEFCENMLAHVADEATRKKVSPSIFEAMYPTEGALLLPSTPEGVEHWQQLILAYEHKKRQLEDLLKVFKVPGKERKTPGSTGAWIKDNYGDSGLKQYENYRKQRNTAYHDMLAFCSSEAIYQQYYEVMSYNSSIYLDDRSLKAWGRLNNVDLRLWQFNLEDPREGYLGYLQEMGREYVPRTVERTLNLLWDSGHYDILEPLSFQSPAIAPGPSDGRGAVNYALLNQLIWKILVYRREKMIKGEYFNAVFHTPGPEERGKIIEDLLTSFNKFFPSTEDEFENEFDDPPPETSKPSSNTPQSSSQPAEEQSKDKKKLSKTPGISFQPTRERLEIERRLSTIKKVVRAARKDATARKDAYQSRREAEFAAARAAREEEMTARQQTREASIVRFIEESNLGRRRENGYILGIPPYYRALITPENIRETLIEWAGTADLFHRDLLNNNLAHLAALFSVEGSRNAYDYIAGIAPALLDEKNELGITPRHLFALFYEKETLEEDLLKGVYNPTYGKLLTTFIEMRRELITYIGSWYRDNHKWQQVKQQAEAGDPSAKVKSYFMVEGGDIFQGRRGQALEALNTIDSAIIEPPDDFKSLMDEFIEKYEGLKGTNSRFFKILHQYREWIDNSPELRFLSGHISVKRLQDLQRKEMRASREVVSLSNQVAELARRLNESESQKRIIGLMEDNAALTATNNTLKEALVKSRSELVAERNTHEQEKETLTQTYNAHMETLTEQLSASREESLKHQGESLKHQGESLKHQGESLKHEEESLKRQAEILRLQEENRRRQEENHRRREENLRLQEENRKHQERIEELERQQSRDVPGSSYSR